MNTVIIKYSLILCFVYSLVSCKKPIVEKTSACEKTYPGLTFFHPKAANLQALMDKYIEMGLPGMALLISDSNGTWMGSSGYADIKNNIFYNTCNASRIASITKPMVVTCGLILHEQGLLNIDDKIAKYINPNIVKNIANADIATIRQCMNHTSGIFDHVKDLKFQTSILNYPTKRWTEEELVRFAYGHPANFPAGTGVSYSNINTILVAMCINAATGKNHGEILHQFIFGPLGMVDSRYYSYDELLPQTTQGYFDLYGNNTLANVSNFHTGIGHTAVFSTVYDLKLFMDALLRNKTLLSAATLNDMMQWNKDNDTTDLGMGLFRKKYLNINDTVQAGIGHTGGEFGYSGKWFYYPYKDMTIISLCNYGTNITTHFGNLYHEFYLEVEKIMKN